MNPIFLIPCIFFALLTAANAGELYSCIDRDGNKIVTDSPQDGMKCVLKESYNDPSPQERAQEQRELQGIARPDERNGAADQEMNKRVELEKRRLKANIEYFKNKPPVKGDKASAESFRRQAEGYEKRLQQLEKDPEYYFYTKEQGEKKSSSDFLPKVGKYRWEVE
jgi:hypothetical protein